MDNEFELFDHAARACVAISSSAFESAPEGAEDPLGAMGYEAADPSLQAPLWHETMHGTATQRDWR